MTDTRPTFVPDTLEFETANFEGSGGTRPDIITGPVVLDARFFLNGTEPVEVRVPLLREDANQIRAIVESIGMRVSRNLSEFTEPPA